MWNFYAALRTLNFKFLFLVIYRDNSTYFWECFYLTASKEVQNQ